MASAADMARHPRPVNAPRRPPATGPRALPALAAAAALLALPGCGLFEAPRTLRGHRVDAEQLAQITPGVQTRQDVQALLGTPSQRGTFDNEHWYYISGTTRQRPGRTLAVEEQRVVAVTFDRGGVVREVRELTEADARPVDLASRETPVPGNERTTLQQLFGNIGRLSPGPAAAGPDAPGPGPIH